MRSWGMIYKRRKVGPCNGWPFAGWCLTLALIGLGTTTNLEASPAVLDTSLQLRLVMYTTNSSGANSVRVAKDPRNNQLYYLKDNGDIFQLSLQPGAASSSTRLYSAADHGLADNTLGMAIGPDGAIYIVGNITTNSGNSTVARVMKGVP